MSRTVYTQLDVHANSASTTSELLFDPRIAIPSSSPQPPIDLHFPPFQQPGVSRPLPSHCSPFSSRPMVKSLPLRCQEAKKSRACIALFPPGMIGQMCAACKKRVCGMVLFSVLHRWCTLLLQLNLELKRSPIC